MQLYYIINNKTVIFYFADIPQNVYHLNINAMYGYIYGTINHDATIIWISTHPNYLKLGIATLLIKIYTLYVKQLGINNIMLDDMSDYARCTNNIYLKLGFKYVENNNTPEMIGNVNELIHGWVKK